MNTRQRSESKTGEAGNIKGFSLTMSPCERQGSELQFRCLNAIISGTTDGYGIIATKHLKLDGPPDPRGIWPAHSGEKRGRRGSFHFCGGFKFFIT